MKQIASLLLPGVAALMLAPAFTTSALAAGEDATVINLTQTACQFVESENGVDHGYTSSEKADCEKINAKTGEERLANSEVLTLKPGKYIFRVTNKNVPYSLGFWVREEGYNWANPLHKLNKTSVSGGGLETGTTLDYEVELKEGEYLYSCPLNTTPDYKLVVKS
ncbi:hypothetical protein [Sneathiella sp.]|uniref:hypothetical protein n=1 Tax=Sneathiella sp. TaxID=1964365 RepID=UPI002611DB3B|nr:hypothetical protein [Sneathiella sp.]MDF2367411.1 hypothetical protein [Sneathiella sp.]